MTAPTPPDSFAIGPDGALDVTASRFRRGTSPPEPDLIVRFNP